MAQREEGLDFLGAQGAGDLANLRHDLFGKRFLAERGTSTPRFSAVSRQIDQLAPHRECLALGIADFGGNLIFFQGQRGAKEWRLVPRKKDGPSRSGAICLWMSADVECPRNHGTKVQDLQYVTL